jgi:hypothetical protein
MKKIINTAFIVMLFELIFQPLVWAANSTDKIDLNYYFGKQNVNDTAFLKTVPTPKSVLGYQVGEWHVRPEQIERYFIELAAKSPRVQLQTYGYTHEKRPLFLAYISSEKNIQQLEAIRKDHLSMPKSTERPAVTWMGYSVHGNEASGSNASLLFAYHMSAATDEQTLAQLDQQIIIVDPMLNPDGLARFASWVNMYKSQNPNSDPDSREHDEAWPRGRTNHYWFDLNRDWLLLQHPESQGRIKMFHHWKPNVLTDFHEMGPNSTYFFQPGVKSRQNPLTPTQNFDLTAKIATYHAKALDEIGSLYFSKESFDDFYYGKGSTYPDINGSIGILFEQASARGHVQETVNGPLTFPFAIKNQLTTSLSTIEAVQENRKQLLQYQRNFYQKAKLNANASRTRAVVYSSKDSYRLKEFHKILTGHQIEFFPLATDLEINEQLFQSEHSFIIPMRQQQSSLIETIFEKRQTFEDNTFYDVSSWNMGLAFDLDFQLVSRSDFESSLVGEKQPEKSVVFEGIDNATIALSFDWDDFASANLLSYLLANDIRVRHVSKPTSVNTSGGKRALGLGDLIIPVKAQTMSPEELTQLLQPKLVELKLQPLAVRSGLALSGPDLGSASLPLINKVKPLMVIGEGVSSYQAGEVWHLLDQRLQQDLSMMTVKQIERIDLAKYSHLIMVNGQFSFSEKGIEVISQWVKAGGVLIAQSGGSKWVADRGWLSSEAKRLEATIDTKASYSERGATRSEHVIGGAIVATTIDPTHPLSFGLADNRLAVFKRGQMGFTEPKEAFVAVARFEKQPLLAGYMSTENRNHLSGKTSILIQGHGEGKLVVFSDDMNFRAFWLGTSRVFTNALYFGSSIRTSQKTEEKASEKPQSNEDAH